MNLSDIAILNIKDSNYSCIFSGIRKNGSLKLNEKCWFYRKKWIIIKHKNLLSHTKMGKEFLTFGDI